MQPFTALTAVAAPLDESKVDTDQLVPARFIRRPRNEGYAQFLFHDLRRSAGGTFVLDNPLFAIAQILVADQNFGVGSSREQAVWALLDAGIRCVVSASFGDIFYNNAANQGLLLIRQDRETLAGLRVALHRAPGARIAIDLAAQTISVLGDTILHFEIEPARKRRLMLGVDMIGFTQRLDREIAQFERAYRDRRPWLFVNPE